MSACGCECACVCVRVCLVVGECVFARVGVSVCDERVKGTRTRLPSTERQRDSWQHYVCERTFVCVGEIGCLVGQLRETRHAYTHTHTHIGEQHGVVRKSVCA